MYIRLFQFEEPTTKQNKKKKNTISFLNSIGYHFEKKPRCVQMNSSNWFEARKVLCTCEYMAAYLSRGHILNFSDLDVLENLNIRYEFLFS